MIEYFEAEIVKRNYRIFYLKKIDELFDSFLVYNIMKKFKFMDKDEAETKLI